MVYVDLALGRTGQPGVRGCQAYRCRGAGLCQGGWQAEGGGNPEGPGNRSGAPGERRLGETVCSSALRQEEKQAGVLGLNTSWKHVSTEVRDYVSRQEARLEWSLGLLRVLFSCTFLLVLHG